MYTHLKEIGSFISTVFFTETERKSYNLTFRECSSSLPLAFGRAYLFSLSETLTLRIEGHYDGHGDLKTLIFACAQHAPGYAILFGTRTTILGLCVE